MDQAIDIGRCTVDRWACVDVFALPLQILLREHKDWREAPAAVIEEDKPRAKILYVNRLARQSHIGEGMRYAEALAILPDLRAGVISAEELARAREELAKELILYSPRVEPSESEAGVFWLDLSGMQTLYPELSAWVDEVRGGLEGLGYVAAVVVGFSRFSTYAVARAYRRTGIYEDPDTERDALARVPLIKLVDQARVQEDFKRLGLETVADLLALPGEGLRRRYGPELHGLLRMARGEFDAPREAFKIEEPVAKNESLDGAEGNSARLLFFLKSLVHQLVRELEERQEKLAALEITFVLDDKTRFEEVIRPAEPTTDELVLVDLLRLWLERIDLGAGVVEVEMLARGLRTTTEQLKLFVDPGRRDLSKANQALARLRAELGPEHIGRLELFDAHLPEARARLVPLERLEEARPQKLDGPILIRRFYPRALVLPSSWDERAGLVHHGGPHIVSGGWWGREVHRTYFFIEDPWTQNEGGGIQWVYYDDRRRRWYVQGEV